MKDSIPILLNSDEKSEQTLCEQRLQLILRLQLNRRVLFHQLNENQTEASFPRSMVMRFITQTNTIHILKKLAFTAVGIKALKSLQNGFTFAQFFHSKYWSTKKSKAPSK
jgi:hypothetical protein